MASCNQNTLTPTSGSPEGLESVERLAKEVFRGLSVPCGREIEIDHVSMLIERPVQTGPFAANLHVRLIDQPARRLRATPLPAQPLFDLRRVLLNPTVDRAVINGNLCHSGSTNEPPKE